MPKLKPNENRKDFLNRCIPQLVKEGKKQDQAVAICNSMFSRQGKESIFSEVCGLEIKESDSDNLIRGGFISTTHLDSGFYDQDRDVWIKDRVDKSTLDVWATELNEGNPRANKVSINHNRRPHVAGVAVKGSAEVIELTDGEWGLYTDVLIDSTREDFADTSSRLDNGLLDSFSIEFSTKDPASGDYLEGAVTEVEQDGGIVRTLLPGTQLEGFTLASQPMNENAVLIKEILKNPEKTKEVYTMDKKEVKEEEKPQEDVPVEEPKEAPAETGKEVSEADYLKLQEIKEKERKEVQDKEIKELVDSRLKDVKEALKEEKVEEKVVKDNPDIVESKELTEFKEMCDSSTRIAKSSMAKTAGKIADQCGMTDQGMLVAKSTAVEARKFNFDIKVSEQKGACQKHLLEMKGLGITTNQNTDTNYLLSAAELADVFDPVVYNVLNQATVTWNILQKEDKSNKGNNQVQFVLKTAVNSTAGAYTGNDVTTGNTTRLKFQTKFKKYQVGIEVDGDMIAAARGGPIGDVFAQEVQDSTDDLLSDMNQDLFKEVGLEDAAGVIGFEYITDQAGNGTLYNLARTQANGLASTTTTDNYINASGARITVDDLRSAKRKAIGTEGANLNNCVFVTSFVQGDKFRGIYDAIQRTAPTSSKFGFEGRPEIDGIPIFEDKDCNNDDWFLVDLETHKIAIWVPPTLEMLGKDSDSQKGFIKTYWCTYNRAPRRMVQIYGCEE